MNKGAYLVFLLSLFSNLLPIKGAKPYKSVMAIFPEIIPVVETVKTPKKVTISFVGDILMDGSVANQIAKNGEDYPWENIKDYFNDDNLTIGNLETSITTKGEIWENKQFNFRSNPKYLSAMKKNGIDMVSLGNNHVLDYGYEGLLDTLENLDKHEILYAGAGRNREDAIKGIVTERNGLKIGFLSYSRVVPDVKWYATNNRPGIVGAYDVHIPEVIQKIKEMKREVDILILSLHWGIELSIEPRPQEIKLARLAIDEGADIIMGHHPHVLQGIEIYNGKPIFYSLGNFVFGTKNDLTSNTIIAQVNIVDKKIDNIKVIPFNIIGGRPTKVEEKDYLNKINYINSLSKTFNVILSDDGIIKVN